GTYVDAIGLTYTRMEATVRKTLRRLPGRSRNND
ncbi:MAG: hypothetical protein H6Q07_2804, partial [Acidobacteria bacterium]|nr:hypothetical protein [Acidobacteriota bacterium]